MSWSGGGSPFGQRILPWKNPIQYPTRGMGAQNIAFPGVRARSFSAFTTTNTSDWQDLDSVTYDIPLQNCVLMFFVTLHVKHSAADATFGFRANIHLPNDGSAGANGTMFSVDNLILPSTADSWMLLSAPLVFSFYLNAATVSPGKHLVTYQLRNYTTGTLTANNGSASDTFVMVVVPNTSVL